jgi:hypothetical protein
MSQQPLSANWQKVLLSLDALLSQAKISLEEEVDFQFLSFSRVRTYKWTSFLH